MLARSRLLTPGPRDLAGPDLRARAPLLPESESRETGRAEPRTRRVSWAYWVCGVLSSGLKLQ